MPLPIANEIGRRALAHGEPGAGRFDRRHPRVGQDHVTLALADPQDRPPAPWSRESGLIGDGEVGSARIGRACIIGRIQGTGETRSTQLRRLRA